MSEQQRSNEYEGKVAIVTGAAIGIGFEIAKQLAVRGASIVLNDVDEAAARLAVEQIESTGAKAVAVIGSAGDLNIIGQMVETSQKIYGRLDIAVANAGITTYGAFLEYPVERFQELVHVNLQGSFFLTQRAAQQMISAGTNGRILLMSSVTGFQYHPDLAAYGMSKAAIRMLAKSLGSELAAHWHYGDALAPGATMTERTLTLDDGNYEEIWGRITPTGRPATTADIAHAALFLLSENAGHITGQTLLVDGGWTSVSPPPE